MTCVEFIEQAPMLALGVLDAEEVKAAEAHLAEPRHDGCFEAMRRASAGVEALARSLVPVKPDERVWKSIEAEIGGGAAGRAALLWRERLAWSAAAAAVVLLLAALAARSRDNRRWSDRDAAVAAAAAHADQERATCAKELASVRGDAESQKLALSLLEAPDTQLIKLAPPTGEGKLSGRALVNLVRAKAVFISGGLSASSDKDYELWVIRGEKKLPAGLLRAGPSGVVLAAIDPLLLTSPPDAVAVTLEPRGGAPQPTGPIVLVGKLPKS